MQAFSHQILALELPDSIAAPSLPEPIILNYSSLVNLLRYARHQGPQLSGPEGCHGWSATTVGMHVEACRSRVAGFSLCTRNLILSSSTVFRAKSAACGSFRHWHCHDTVQATNIRSAAVTRQSRTGNSLRGRQSTMEVTKLKQAR